MQIYLIFIAELGDAQGARFGIPIPPAQRSAAEIRAVPDQRIAPTDPTYGATTTRRTIRFATVCNQFGMRSAGSDSRGVGQRSDLVVFRRQGATRKYQEDSDQILRTGADCFQVGE